jgi:GNAT superfamily N-acetyltransferase
MAMNLFDYSVKKLEIGDIYSFDCGDSDLNDFFLRDAVPHQEQLIGTTYFFYQADNKSAIAFFTVLNDAIKTETFKDLLPQGKKYPLYPAVKIGRLGVSKEYQHLGIGKQLMNFIKRLCIFESTTACRFLTVDAYNTPETLEFYEKCDFSFFTHKDKNKYTRTLKCDLKPYRDQLIKLG